MRTGWMVELASCIFCCKYNTLRTIFAGERCHTWTLEGKGLTPGQLHGEVEAGGGGGSGRLPEGLWHPWAR